MGPGARTSIVAGSLGVYALAVLSAVCGVAGLAESSALFRIDRQATLDRLAREIARIHPGIPTPVEPSSSEVQIQSELREVKEVVKAGDTLPAILERLGVRDADVTNWTSAATTYRSLGKLQPQHALAFLLPRGSDRLEGLQYEIAADAVLVLRNERGSIRGRVERVPSPTRVQIIAGEIESSFYASARRAGAPDAVISRFVDIFGWDVDFRSDLRPGDSFRIGYEAEDASENSRAARKTVVAAELIVRGKAWRAVLFEGEDEGARYYSPEGRPYGRAFLRYPLEFSRISSIFTDARMHPILGVVRPHLGVDFAAPRGTPIRAIGAGRVRFARWEGGFGRTVRIDHGGGISSQYSHMNTFARGLREGTSVDIGEVIGTVGATGLATGPHCHFALWRNGAYVDPLRAKLPLSDPLEKRFISKFARVRDERLAQLSGTATDDPLASARNDISEPQADRQN